MHSMRDMPSVHSMHCTDVLRRLCRHVPQQSQVGMRTGCSQADCCCQADCTDCTACEARAAANHLLRLQGTVADAAGVSPLLLGQVQAALLAALQNDTASISGGQGGTARRHAGLCGWLFVGLVAIVGRRSHTAIRPHELSTVSPVFAPLLFRSPALPDALSGAPGRRGRRDSSSRLLGTGRLSAGSRRAGPAA